VGTGGGGQRTAGREGRGGLGWTAAVYGSAEVVGRGIRHWIGDCGESSMHGSISRGVRVGRVFCSGVALHS